MSFLKQLEKDINKAGKDLSRAADSAVKYVDNTVNENWSSTTLDQFRSGNILQLICIGSQGRSMQIVMSPDGRLVVDGNGPHDIPTAYNTHWTVTNHGKNTISLHNQNNYLAIINGCTQIIPITNHSLVGEEVKFRLVQKGQNICLESMREKSRYVAFLPNGQLKSALASTRGTEAELAPRIMYTPYTAATAQGKPAQVVTITTPAQQKQ